MTATTLPVMDANTDGTAQRLAHRFWTLWRRDSAMGGDLRSAPPLRVAIGSLGAIGTEVAARLDRGIPGLALAAVSARDFDKARQKIGAFLTQPRLVELEELAEWADIVVECAPASVYDRIAHPAVETARVLVTTSCGALLSRPELIDRARKTGARIIVPSGGILGLDALKAAAEGDVYSVTLITRKPPSSLAGARYLSEHAIDVLALKEPLRVFAGNAREAVLAFPASANVAATLSLAGIGAERTQVEIWADPFVSHNIQCVQVRAAAADFDLRLASHPLADNPRTGSLTPKSVVATLRSLRSHLTIGGI